MINYDEMGDKQLSGSVFVANHGDISGDKDMIRACGRFDINNPSDIMPLAIEHGISLESNFNGSWTASKPTLYDYEEEPIEFDAVVTHTNPYRALSICFLKMMENKQ